MKPSRNTPLQNRLAVVIISTIMSLCTGVSARKGGNSWIPQPFEVKGPAVLTKETAEEFVGCKKKKQTVQKDFDKQGKFKGFDLLVRFQFGGSGVSGNTDWNSVNELSLAQHKLSVLFKTANFVFPVFQSSFTTRDLELNKRFVQKEHKSSQLSAGVVLKKPMATCVLKHHSCMHAHSSLAQPQN